jgi:uncharacterized membrane protein YcaP (DUF421 family)
VAPLLAVAARSVFAYVFLLVLIRLSGKRSLWEATALDFVLAIVVGDLVDNVFWGDVPAASFVVAAGALALAHASARGLAYRSRRWADLLNGSPVELMRGGRPVPAGMRKERIRGSDLAALLRGEGIEREAWGDVALARMELEGRLSVLKKKAAQEVKKGDVDPTSGAS